MTLAEIIKDIDVDTILIDSNNTEWTVDNIDASEDEREYCVDGEGIWELDESGYRASVATYKFAEVAE